MLAAVIFPVACIWFCEEMGAASGAVMGMGHSSESGSTPGIVLATGGWILLIAQFAAICIVGSHHLTA